MEKTEIMLADLKEKTDLRRTLSDIRKAIREGQGTIGRLIAGDSAACQKIVAALYGDDAKTRKSAALLTGELPWDEASEDNRDMLIRALLRGYFSEKTLFVRESYLKSLEELGGLDAVKSDDRAQLHERLEYIDTHDFPASDVGHIMSERRALVTLLHDNDSARTPVYFSEPHYFPVLLVPVSGLYQPLKDALRERGINSGFTSVGVLVSSDRYSEVRDVRLYSAIAYQIDGRFGSGESDLMEDIRSSDIDYFLENAIKDGIPSIRIMVHEKKDCHAAMAKRLTDAFMYMYRGRMINEAPYDLTFHFYPRKSGGYALFIKPVHQNDSRFKYAQKRLSTSMRPAKAAIMVWLIRNYLKEDARVADIFSGNGTLLLERDEYKRAKVLFATDTNEDAIAAGRINAEKKGRTVYFVRRSAFTFESDEQFDEIISELPDLYDLQEKERESFFEKTAEATMRLLKKGGYAFYLSSGNGVPSMIRKTTGLVFREEIPFDEKRSIYVIKRD